MLSLKLRAVLPTFPGQGVGDERHGVLPHTEPLFAWGQMWKRGSPRTAHGPSEPQAGSSQGPGRKDRGVPWSWEALPFSQGTSQLKYASVFNGSSSGDLFIFLKHGQGGARLLSGV